MLCRPLQKKHQKQTIASLCLWTIKTSIIIGRALLIEEASESGSPHLGT